jgi:Etoposide-induced protein 2.4 (EI24)
VTLFEAFWRALATVTQPRVWAWALLPLGVVLAAVGTLAWLLWEPSLDAVRALVGRVEISDGVLRWLHDAGWPQWRAMLAPIVVVVLALPLVLLGSLLAVALLAAPAIARQVATRRYPALVAQQGCGLPRQLLWTLGSTLAAVLALGLSLPLWLVPPLALVLPPLIWGWLAARVLGYHALAHHAAPDERRQVRRGRRGTLWLMGLATGYLALLPALLWSLGSVAFVLAPFFLLAAAVLFVAVFVFAAAWFAHLSLAELAALRASAAPPAPALVPVPAPLVIESPTPGTAA